MRDLIVIGGGAAGLSAAMYAWSKQLDVILIAGQLGGKAGWHQQLLGQATEEYIAGEEIVTLFSERLRAQPGLVVSDQVRSITRSEGVFQVETARHGVEQSAAVIIATGVSPVNLEVPGAEELLGHGLGYSATTHAPALTGKSVAVVGATPRALRGADELARVAQQVFLVAPDAAQLETPLGRALQRLPTVQALGGYQAVEIAGAFNVEELVVARGDETRRLSVDAVFVDLGLRANSDLVRGLATLEDGGLIWVDSHNATTLPGLYAAGDVTTTLSEHILIAIGEGARAAMSAHDYILAHAVVR